MIPFSDKYQKVCKFVYVIKCLAKCSHSKKIKEGQIGI